jgi:hypothetical protein
VLTRFIRITAASNQMLQVAELQAFTPDNVNVALGKSCTATSVYRPGTHCGLALDGNTSGNIDYNFYHSGANGASMQVDLGANHKIVRVVFHNRQSCCAERIIGARVELYSETNVLLARSYINTAAARTSLQFAMASPPICETAFQGGGWLLVRHLNANATKWFQTNDDLRGFEVYGDYSLGINAATPFSINYRTLVNASTEFLFSTGVILISRACYCTLLLVYDFVVYLISLTQRV